jgi:hypothetical protein
VTDVEASAQVDPEVNQAVTYIRDRHGPKGLRDLIGLARQELARTEAALAELAAWDAQQTPPRAAADGAAPPLS